MAETILRIGRRTRYCVVEISGGRPGVMDLPLRISRPKIGVLTVIGRDHYRAFGTPEGIVAEKSKLINSLPSDGIAILNVDDPQVRTVGEAHSGRRIWVGRGEEADIRLLDVQSRWPDPLQLTVEYGKSRYQIQTRLHGEHLALSVLCALGVAVALGLPFDEAIDALSRQESAEGRMQIVRANDGVVFIRDDWKAPYWSLKEPLKFLQQARADRKVAVVGTLSDYSGDATAQYKKAARLIRQYADLVVFVGPHAHRAERARLNEIDQSIVGFSSLASAAEYLESELRAGDLVLLKGSNRADHLVRLLLNRNQPISCWKVRCGLNDFCTSCPETYGC